ncbi:MAG: murein biosynthesis integral membrane protein MurJ [Patescibacteria group bacterium]
MVNRILNHKSKTIFSAAFILAASALVSRLLGLFRDRLLAGRFGAGDELDIYFAAFRLPDLIYNILIIGAISSAFIPVFAQYFKKDEKEAWYLTNGVFNLIFLILVISAGLFIFLAPSLISVIAPGFSGTKKEMTILLTRIMFLSPLFLGMSSIFSGVLQYFHRFFVYSLAPIMYNLGIIFGILIFVPKFGLVGLAWGVVLGTFLHFFIQLPSVIYSGFRWQKVLTIYHQGIRKIIKLMIPRTIGLAGSQMNLLVITALASTLASGSLAVFNLADNLQYIPIGIIGISFAMAVFPRLAKAFAEENKEEFSRNFSSVFSQILYLVLPITVLLFLLRAQIVRIILGTGQFGWLDTRLTAAALGVFSFGIFAQSLIPLISRAFYSFHNTKTPVIISLWSVGLNILSSFTFIWLLNNKNIFSDFLSHFLKLGGISNFSVIGLPMAFVVAGIFNFLLLLIYFDKKISLWRPKFILNSLAKILVSCIFMGFTIYALLYCLNLFVNTHTFVGIFIQAGGAAIGGVAIYFIISLLLKSPEAPAIIRKIFHPGGGRPKGDKI